MNAEAKHKTETANSTQKSLLKYYYTRLPGRRVNFGSTFCVGFLSLQIEIQAANEHETGLGIFSPPPPCLCSPVFFSLWSISFCTTVYFHKKNYTLQPTAEYHIKITQQEVLFFLAAETLRNCINLSVIVVFVILDNKTSHLKSLSRIIANPKILS